MHGLSEWILEEYGNVAVKNMGRALVEEYDIITPRQIGRQLPVSTEHKGEAMFRNESKEPLLLCVPDGLFVAAIEAGVRELDGRWKEAAFYDSPVPDFRGKVDNLLNKGGAPYRFGAGERIEWVGEKSVEKYATQPAFTVMREYALDSAAQDYRTALTKLRSGRARELNEAIFYAGRTVEDILKELTKRLDIDCGERDGPADMWHKLRAKEIGRPWAKQLVLTACIARNQMGGHASPPVSSPNEAEAVIVAAAASIIYLSPFFKLSPSDLPLTD